ncbi:oligosaccharide flippase family protein [Vibrio europaeus]|uniref:Oligosaccharide flippase family protein n=1 Tax=Vibrio europaeus TaxID=300876 RepID=A0AAE7AW63_9VIBR|nr:oligosaccharide flippase family protein [Vibrio europaeus]MDC5804545.1 oligosaccharide flippase family protein [Vibrio europaeus]MDC5808607.1 oligosaccharide flippase family protein [Vibrio europaeus]MDC5825133.1 oligosaccharide flippase family protein [Vibrio europaeus]MDC5829494.1 oligosaccharide flippase family protein [Vibrio europaeus]MDC5836088.1 oligosaccharide flippase family protein [Vibrio europaeus]
MKRGLVGNSFIYLFSNILNAAIPFLLLPILTRMLDPEGYGMVTMFTMLVTVLGVFVGLSVHGAIGVRYYELSSQRLTEYVSSTLLILFASCFLLLIFIYFSDFLTDYTLLTSEWIALACTVSMCTFIVNVRLVLWQVKTQAIKYGTLQVSMTLTNTLVSLALIYFYKESWESRVFGIVSAAYLFAVIAMFLLIKGGELSQKPKIKYIKDALKFGIPLLPHAGSAFVIAMIDRFIIASLMGEQSVGIYMVALQFGLVMGLMADAFNKAYSPWVYRMLSSGQEFNKLVVTGASYLVFLFFLIVQFPIYIFIKLAFKHIVGEDFHAAFDYIIWFVIGNSFVGMYYAVSVFYFYTSKTSYLSMISFSVGVGSTVITYKLVSAYGLFGGAISFTITNIVMFMLAKICLSKIINLPWYEFKSSYIALNQYVREQSKG